MARTPSETINPPSIVETPGLPAVAREADAMILAEKYATEQRDIARLIGRREGRTMMAKAFQKLYQITDLLDLQAIKESKKYKGFRVSVDGELVTITTWAEYCLHVEGRSVESVDLELGNFKQLGNEFFDAMRQLGVGPGSMRDIRRLPEDAQQALMVAAETADKEVFLDLAESLIAKHAQEKAELKKAADEAKANYAAQCTVSEMKQKSNDALQLEVARIEKLSPDESLEDLRAKVLRLAGMAEVSVLALRPGLNALNAYREAHPGIDAPMLEGLLANVEAALIGLRNEFGLKDAPSADTRPEWVAVLEAEQAAEQAAAHAAAH